MPLVHAPRPGRRQGQAPGSRPPKVARPGRAPYFRRVRGRPWFRCDGWPGGDRIPWPRGGQDMRTAAPGRRRRGDRGVLHAARHGSDPGRRLLVACLSRPARLDLARRAGGGRGGAVLAAPGPGTRGPHPGRVHAGAEPADLAGRRADPGQSRDGVGAVRDRAGRLRAVLLPPGPPGRVRLGRPPRAGRRPAVARAAHSDHDRPAAHGRRPAGRALLRRAAAARAGAAGPGRARRAGAVPAGRAGQGRGAGKAGGRDARRGDPPGQPDGAAGRRAAR